MKVLWALAPLEQVEDKGRLAVDTALLHEGSTSDSLSVHHILSSPASSGFVERAFPSSLHPAVSPGSP